MGQEGWSAHADSVPGSWKIDRLVKASALTYRTGFLLPIGAAEAELEQPAHLMELAVQSSDWFFPLGEGAEPANDTAWKGRIEAECSSSEEQEVSKGSFHLSFHCPVDGLSPRRQSVFRAGRLFEASLRGCRKEKVRNETPASRRVSILRVPREH
jgi:hypothetical protein